MTSSRTVLAGTRTRVVRQGDAGPVVLFLHGYTDSADTWAGTFAALLHSHLRCVAVDLPSHGTASNLRRPIAIESFDAFVAAAVRKYDEGDGVVLVGNSLGGLLSLRAAANGILPVAGVVALGSPDERLHPLLARLPWIARPVIALLTIPVLPDAMLGRLAAAGYTRLARTRAPKAYRTHLGRRRLRELIILGRAIVAELHDPAAGRSHAALDRDLPSLRVWGERDVVCPVEHGTRAQPDVRVVAGLGHCPQVEQPGLVAGLVHELVARVHSETTRTA